LASIFVSHLSLGVVVTLVVVVFVVVVYAKWQLAFWNYRLRRHLG